MLRLFISSVQKEFASERAALRSNVDVVGSIAAQPESRPESQPESFDVRVPVMTLRRRPEKAFAAVGGQVTGQVTGQVAGQVTGEVAGEVAGEVTGEVLKLLQVAQGALSRRELRQILLLRGDDNFRQLYLVPAINAGFMEMTIPDKPNSRLQKYRLTAKGRTALAALQPKGNA